MKNEHEKLIAHRKGLAAFYKALKIYSKYTVEMNDVTAVKKMITEHRISEENITKAIIAYNGPSNGEHHARSCIYKVRKAIYKGDQRAYAYLIRVACRQIVSWRNATGSLEVGALAHCDLCGKLEKIIEIC